MKDYKFTHDMARLEDARRRTQERLKKQQERIDQRFDRMQNQLERKFGKPSVTQQHIIEAALDLLKQDGLANLTQRKLATKLDMQAPALYWHFKNKEVLVDYMAEAILQKEFKDIKTRKDNERWQDWLTDCMKQLRKAMLAYPDGARVVAGAHIYPAVTLGKIFESVLESLTSAGIDLQTARLILMTASTYTFGFVIEEQSAPNSEELKMLDADTFRVPYPRIAQAMQEAHHSVKSFDKDYSTGLQYIIKGSTG